MVQAFGTAGGNNIVEMHYKEMSMKQRWLRVYVDDARVSKRRELLHRI